MYLVVIGILSLVLAFSGPPFRLVMQTGWIMASVAAATLAPAAVAVLITRRALRLLDSSPADPSIGQYSFGRGMTIVRIVLGVLHGALLCTTNWMRLCTQTPVVGDWLAAPGMLAIVPFLISVMLVWTATYPADRAMREIALETYLFRGRPVRPATTMLRYLMFNMRHQVLFILAPMLLILAARDLVARYGDQIRAATGQAVMPDMLLGLAAVAVAVVAPVLLRRIWVTEPLPAGPLRDRLSHLCVKLKMRCREILVWYSGGMLINAAVMGVVAPFRYFLITDGMLEQMEDRHVEAVFGHEAGHVKQHHILFFLLFAFVSACAVTALSYRGREMNRLTYQIAIVVAAGLLALKWGVLFGWISRCFERQADVYSVRTLAADGLPCQTPCVLHQPADNEKPVDKAAEGHVLCRSAAHLFGDTLGQVAALNGIPTQARSWRHGSIASRTRTVLAYSMDPMKTMRFERRVSRIKIGIVVAVVVSGLSAAWSLKLWTLLGIGGD